VTAQIEVAEMSVRELHDAMTSGRATSVEITSAYLARIEAYDRGGPRLNAMLRLNPQALTEAEALDRERAAGRVRGPLHGIPVVLKDNYDTRDMPTSAGTLALAALVAPDDAFQVGKLREAGVVVLGKTNMHELASGITTIASLGGQTLNPYDPTRNPGGSSGGTGAAIAASLAAVGWGSDTCGSIRIPAAHNELFGLRPTKGLSSIDGIVPLSHTQDVGGPLARTVEDLAIALDATVGPDPADPATRVLSRRAVLSFVASLEGASLEGMRIGVFEPLFGDDPEDGAVGAVVRGALARMEGLGATLVPMEMTGFAQLIATSSVIGLEFKWDLMDYLAGVPAAPVQSLEEIIRLGLVHDAVMGTMRRWDEPTERDSDAYRAALAARDELREAILTEMNARSVDVLAYPVIRRIAARVGAPQAGTNCQLSAHTGLPAMALPAGRSDGLPVGMELLGRPFDDPRLVAMAYAYEQAVRPRLPPAAAPPLGPRGVVAARTAQLEVQSGSARGRVRLTYDAAASALLYETEITGAAPGDVYAVVLRRTDDQGRWSVAANLSGPGVLTARGRLDLGESMRARVDAGELWVELVTRGDPVTSGRAQLVLQPR
jgi:Asp-tRNA(Asn)/Glu-tRNA(Gln) amidotransferase A subunit family amidase